ncbi:MAG: hypothetical protein WA947_21890 [Phormidesmis sp.]
MTSTPPSSPAKKVAIGRSTGSSVGRRIRAKLSEYLIPFVWLAILLSAGGVGLRAVSVMTQNPPLPDCARLAVTASDSERLLCAQASVKSGSAQALIEAIELVEPWQSSNPQYEEANQLMDRWSKALLSELEQMVQRGEMRRAVTIANRIPTRVAIYPEVKSAIATWDKEWMTGREIEAKILKAIKAQDWVAARRDLQSLKILNSDYWVNQRHLQLRIKIDREQTARVKLNKARALAKTGDLEKLGEAFAIARDIDLETAAWKEAKPDLDQWAERVMQYSFQKWEEEDIAAAIEVVQLVPPDIALTAEAKDLLSFGHAQRLAEDEADSIAPSYVQIYSLVEAIEAVQRISPISPFYREAQDSLIEWQMKLADIRKLQYANTLAQIGQRKTYEWAIAEAQTITQERPQRIQAQTLVSHWQKEIQRQEDRPILTQAIRYASAGGKENLQKAIAQAGKVSQGRALRIEGQTYIAEWEDRIETIEDQPIFSKAEQLAERGDLRDAIAQAQKIKKDRALYDDALLAIKGWTEEVETIEDTPIMVRAESYAARGSLSAAIDTAAQIAPGRALYLEARTSIAIWDRERAYIWSLQAPAEESYAAPDYRDDGYSDNSYYGQTEDRYE